MINYPSNACRHNIILFYGVVKITKNLLLGDKQDISLLRGQGEMSKGSTQDTLLPCVFLNGVQMSPSMLGGIVYKAHSSNMKLKAVTVLLTSFYLWSPAESSSSFAEWFNGK